MTTVAGRAAASPVRALVEGALLRHPRDVARRLEKAELAEASALVEAYDRPRAWGVVLLALSSERAARLMEAVSRGRAATILEAMEAPRAASLLSRVDDESRRAILSLASPGLRKEIDAILTFPDETAGRVMDPRVMAFPGDTPMAQVLERLRELPEKRLFEVYVVGDKGELEGTVPLQEVAVAPPEDSLSSRARPPVAFVQATATREEVVELLEERNLPVLPVVDFEGRLLGAIRYDALLTAAREETSADLLTMVGASKEERALSRVSFAVRKRLPWLQVNLGTAFLAASVVGIFEDTIARFTALAVLLPVVAGQSGNTGAQALAVVMRGLALREIRTRQWWPVLFKEVRVGFLNGVAVAITTSFFVFLWSRSIGLAAVIGFSMVISMAIAGLSGGAIPLLLTSIGQDPAQSSSIILTTVTDIVGFFSFLGIATMLSGML